MKELLSNLKMVWKYARDDKKYIIFYGLLHIVGIALSIIVPIIGANMIVNLTSNILSQVVFLAFVILILEILRNFLNYFCGICANIVYKNSFNRIQLALGKEMLKLENKDLDNNTSGTFIQRLTGDISQLSDIFNSLGMYVSILIEDIGIFIAVFVVNKIAFIYLLICTLIVMLIENTRTTFLKNNEKELRNRNDRLTGLVGEMVRGARDIKMLNAEKSFIKEIERNVHNTNDFRYSMMVKHRKFLLLGGNTRDLTDLGLIIVIVLLMASNMLPVASAIILYNYSRRLPNLANHIGKLLENIKNFNLSSTRVFEIINGVNFTKEKFGKKHLKKVHGNFEFNHVSFSYNQDNPVLKDISFKIHANETVAFVGKSGAGKTTIFNLLCKMYEADSGKITIDNNDIKDLDKDSIRGNITIISQNPYIFNMTIKENLKLVKSDLTDEEMIQACKMACLDDYIESLPDKYDTLVGEGGINLSGGQKQRLAIARAFVQKTEIILFDEATSALDNETQEKIKEAIDNMKGEYTILIIAHRLTTIKNADRLLFLEDGTIKAEGTHSKLLKTCKEYKKLYQNETINK